MNNNIQDNYKKLIVNPKENSEKPQEDAFFSILKDAKDTDYINFFNYKKNREFYDIGFQVNNLVHDKHDYSNYSILSCFDGFEIIKDAVKSKIDNLEISIAIAYKIYKHSCEMINFFIEHKENIRNYIIDKKIELFTLDSSKDIRDDYPYDYNPEILYNGVAIYKLAFLNQSLWSHIGKILRDLDTLNVLMYKMEETISNDYDTKSNNSHSEIINKLSKDYSNLFKDYDPMDEDEYKEEYVNKTWFYDKNTIANLAVTYTEKHKDTLNYISKDLYTFYLRKSFEGFFMVSDLYDTYRCIVHGYEVKLKDLFEDKE